jgi:hypothetical protein
MVSLPSRRHVIGAGASYRSSASAIIPSPDGNCTRASSGRAIGVHPPKTCPGAPPHFMNTKILHSLLSTLYDRLPNSHFSYIVPPHIGYTPKSKCYLGLAARPDLRVASMILKLILFTVDARECFGGVPGTCTCAISIRGGDTSSKSTRSTIRNPIAMWKLRTRRLQCLPS